MSVDAIVGINSGGVPEVAGIELPGAPVGVDEMVNVWFPGGDARENWINCPARRLQDVMGFLLYKVNFKVK